MSLFSHPHLPSLPPSSFPLLFLPLFFLPFPLLPLLSSSLHLNSSIDASREPVPDASAVYFLTPSQKNINRICRDLHSHIYDSYYFNFINPISRPLLEELAKATVDTNSISHVTKVR